jgi:hypothetical protein
MDQQPMRDPRILERMEACRPGADDVADPAMAPLAAELASNPELDDLFTRLQKLDATLAGAIQDVPVPDGLADRLLRRLEASHVAVPQPAVSPTADRPLAKNSAAIARVEATARAARRPIRSRYFRWVLAVSAMVAIVVPTLVVLYQWRMAHAFTPHGVLSEALDFYVNELHAPGLLVADVAPPPSLPLSPAVLPMPGARWRHVRGFLDRSGVAYDLLGPRGTQATLYVVRRTVAGVPTAPPARPSLATGNCSTSTWQEGRLLYVLVVRGDASAYSGFLDLPRGPLT